MLSRLKILFLCTGNSCRSQMAEAWTRSIHPDRFEPYSAGTKPCAVDPRAIAVMSEVGIDISKQRSKSLADLDGIDFDCIVTVCDAARESCPIAPGRSQHLHADFDDPPRLVKDVEGEAALAPYRRVRDEIRAYVVKLPEILS